MKILNRENAGIIEKLPLKIIQFGEGNFLRAFVDYIVDKLNKEANFNAGVVVVQPLENGLVDILNKQDGLYHLFMQGIQKGKKVEEKQMIDCIQYGINPYKKYDEYLELAKSETLQFLISNTTEAGITFDKRDTLNDTPHKTFPAKLTAFLYVRFKHFNGDDKKGLTIIPCELINYNADTLKNCIIKYAEAWKLEPSFLSWIEMSNSFHNTLVDRIVPGYPKESIDYYQNQIEFEDRLIVSSEVFLLWVIEGGEELKRKIPFDQIDENILIVDDMQQYRTRKVRILNGAHTSMVPFSILYGNETVEETVNDKFTGNYIKDLLFKEIIPTLPLPENESGEFAEAILDRFRNPFIKHQLSTIALNSIAKFQVRVLPSILIYQKKYNRLPLALTYSFACLIRFYQGEWKQNNLPIKDDDNIVELLKNIWESHSYDEIAAKVLKDDSLWGEDLTSVPQLANAIASALQYIDNKGIKMGFEEFSKEFAGSSYSEK